MKAIEIKTDLKFVFLDAVKACRLTAEELPMCHHPGQTYFRITTPGVSMNDLFQLGVYFAQKTFVYPSSI